jgi:hypothetical protein
MLAVATTHTPTRAAAPEAIALVDVVGTYHRSEGDLGSCRLEITEHGRYSQTCFQGHEMRRSHGRVQLGRKSLALVDAENPSYFARPEDIDALAQVGPARAPLRTFLPITLRLLNWGQRRYLLASGQLLEFCIAAAKGVEARTHPAGPFYLRLYDAGTLQPLHVPTECENPAQAFQ